jgi:hypothetical protein
MKTRHWRNLLLVTIAAALCFGGTFVCTSHHDDQTSGVVIINP